ncbi:MAG TPA: GNAT family N-acetyltransferase [Verrucomicrobiae bacterium]|nr:GNAT family N-acetyltransferase [Verrucomicrobiae bacterium]
MSASTSLAWRWYRFDELPPAVLYEMMRLRSAIFVVEQDCVFPDMDGRDPQCEHLGGYDGERLVAGLRLVPPGVRTPEVSLGRVVVAREARGRGLGRAVMQEGLRACAQRHPGAPVKVSAQQHLEKFYESLGFRTVAPMYMEDGIPHVDMVRA